MSDPNAPAPAEQPKLLHNYRIICLNGWSVNVASPADFQAFCKVAKADGYIASDVMFIVYDNIVSIESIGPFDQRQNVLPFGGHPTPQVVKS